MPGKKIYLQPIDMVLNAVHDLAELQKGKLTICDTPRGLISFHVTMYDFEWEYQFTVTDIGKNRCGVTIELAGDALDKERMIDHEFALLDYALIDRAKIEFAQIEEEDRRIIASRNAHPEPDTTKN